MPDQSSARIWPSLSASPAFTASIQSCSSCLTDCATLGPFAAGVAVWAMASPTLTITNKTAPEKFFIMVSLLWEQNFCSSQDLRFGPESPLSSSGPPGNVLLAVTESNCRPHLLSLKGVLGLAYPFPQRSRT